MTLVFHSGGGVKTPFRMAQSSHGLLCLLSLKGCTLGSALQLGSKNPMPDQDNGPEVEEETGKSIKGE